MKRAKKRKTTSGKRGAAKRAPKKRNPSRSPRRSAKRRSNPAVGMPAIVINPSGPRASNPKRRKARRKSNPGVKSNPSRRYTRRRNPGGLSVGGILTGSALLAGGAVAAVLGGKALAKYGPVLEPTTTAAVQAGVGIAGGIAAAYFGGGYGAAFGAGFAGGSLQPGAVMVINKLSPPADPAMKGLGRLGYGYRPAMIDDPNIRLRQLAPFMASADTVIRDTVIKDRLV